MNKELLTKIIDSTGEEVINEVKGILRGDDRCTTDNLVYYTNTFIQAVQKKNEYFKPKH